MTEGRRPRVAVLADDLIWATRLAAMVTEVGGRPETVRSVEALVASLETVDAAIVDLGLRSGQATAAIGAVASTGRPVIAVGPHEAAAVRKAALAAGASRVYAYRKLFEDGRRTIAAWLELVQPGSRSAATPPTDPHTVDSPPDDPPAKVSAGVVR